MREDPEKNAVPLAPLEETEEEIGLLDYLHVIVKWRRPLAGFVLLAVVGVGLHSLSVPPTFTAFCTFLPSTPTQPAVSGELGGVLRRIAFGGMGPVNRAEIYPNLARSKAVMEGVLTREFVTDQFDNPHSLLEILGIEVRSEVQAKRIGYGLLSRMIAVEVEPRTGIVTLAATTPEPQLSADLANALVEELNNYNLTSRTSRARENREFIEKRLTETKAALTGAEESLKRFREKNVSIGNSPQLRLEEDRLLREVRIQEEIFLTLTEQYELAKIEERRDLPVIDILDPAEPPLTPSGPHRRLRVTFAAVVSLFLGILGVFVLEYWANLGKRSDRKRLVESWSGMLQEDVTVGKQVMARGMEVWQRMRARFKRQWRV